VRVLHFVPQAHYDKLLWACDFNFVRGEDSFVRAQWAGKPFIWHIYPQEKNLHHVKLKAFLQTYVGSTDSLAAFSMHWNEAALESSDWKALWNAFTADTQKMTQLAMLWQQQLSENGDLASNLIQFTRTVFVRAHPK
jgi:uncharacterized repeat protein (TIGR03837 family)